ncbi:hypothetical protein ACWGJP_16155 [Microbacterium sp. NPDC055903]
MGEAELDLNGEAFLIQFPVGEIRDFAGSTCLDWDGATTFTGEATWTADDHYMITMTAADGEALLGPYNPALGDLVWTRFGTPFCDHLETMWYRSG